MSKRKRRRLILVISIAAISFLGWFSISRAGHLFYKNLYLYFSMQPYMFNVWANIVDDIGIMGYSEASFNGFSFVVLYIIKNLLNLDFPTHWEAIYKIIRETDSQWQVITNTFTRANAYVTAFWFFYLDGRLWGIIIGMFYYGVYVAHSFVEAVKYTNIKTVCIFSFILQGVLWSFIRFPFSNIYYAVSYIALIFLVFKRKKNIDY